MVLKFFETSTRNLLTYEGAAGVGHHVALSVVGTQRLSESGYFRAKIAQEKLIKGSSIPYSIVHATPFFATSLRPEPPVISLKATVLPSARSKPHSIELVIDRIALRDDSEPRLAESLEAALKAYGWEARPSPRPIGNGEILTGRGLAYAVRSQTIVVQIVDVEVNRRTGHVWAKRIVTAHGGKVSVTTRAGAGSAGRGAFVRPGTRREPSGPVIGKRILR